MIKTTDSKNDMFVLVSQSIEIDRSSDFFKIVSEAIRANREYAEYYKYCMENNELPAYNECSVYHELNGEFTPVNLDECAKLLIGAGIDIGVEPPAKAFADKAVEHLAEASRLLRYVASDWAEDVEQTAASIREEFEEEVPLPFSEKGER